MLPNFLDPKSYIVRQPVRQLLHGVCYTRFSPFYACGESNLDLNVEIYQCLMAGFDVWLKKLPKNAPENVLFLRCFLLILFRMAFFGAAHG